LPPGAIFQHVAEEPARLKHWGKTRTAIHMIRRASRITLEITNVHVERLQAITEKDAIAEGIERAGGFMTTSGCWQNYGSDGPSFPRAVDSYLSLWDSINGKGAWKTNPWV